MSSEESDGDNDSIVVKPLLWRSAKATEFLQNLDLLGPCRHDANAMKEC